MINRRDFLKLSPLGLLSMCLAPQPTQEPESALPGFVDVREYGEVGKGRTIQLALDDGLPNNVGNRTGKTFIIPRGEWLIDEPLRLNQRADVRIIGAGRSVVGTVLRLQAPIEVIGANRMIFENLYCKGEGVDVGFVTARTPGWLNSAQITFNNVECYGDFRKAAWYCVGSEMNRWENCSAAIYYPNESCITIAINNEYGISTSVPILEGYGAYSPNISKASLGGDMQVPLKLYGSKAVMDDVYTYCKNGRASVEIIGGGGIKMRTCGFEGTPFATLRLTYRDGHAGVFLVDFDSFSFGNPSNYEIWADDKTKLRNSKIKKQAHGKGVRLYAVEMSDLSGLGVHDSRAWTLSAFSLYATKVRLGLSDVLDCKNLWGIEVENYSTPGQYKIERFGFVD